MQFDDRLATVLRMQADHPRAAATQFRQLLDLAGSAPGAEVSSTQNVGIAPYLLDLIVFHLYLNGAAHRAHGTDAVYGLLD